jgi:beta-galactosidase/beta-glucuronidase
MFVVFRKPAHEVKAEATLTQEAVAVTGEWTVEFEPNRGAPASITMPKLISWTQHADPGVQYFSGTAKYRKHFTLPAGWRGSRVELDLGRLWTIGEVWVNGKSLGTLWTPPYTADATAALREGENELTVEVTNVWFNRLIGDARGVGPQRITRTNVTVSGSKPWKALEPLDSGLFGPVRLLRTK